MNYTKKTKGIGPGTSEIVELVVGDDEQGGGTAAAQRPSSRGGRREGGGRRQGRLMALTAHLRGAEQLGAVTIFPFSLLYYVTHADSPLLFPLFLTLCYHSDSILVTLHQWLAHDAK